MSNELLDKIKFAGQIQIKNKRLILSVENGEKLYLPALFVEHLL